MRGSMIGMREDLRAMAGDIAGVHIRIDHRVFWPFGLA